MDDNAEAIVPRRRMHTKSRRGCRTCKSRHIKCDEQTPQCANCLVRDLNCDYGTSSQPSATASSSQPEYTSHHIQPQGGFSLSIQQGPMSNAGVNVFQMTLPLPDVSSDMPTSTHRLELELMHRWSTKTWMSAYSVPEDQQLLQIEIPRLALGEDYLLNSLLALAAADMYMSGRPEFRVPAYHYAQQSYADLNLKMQTVTRDDVIPLHIMHLISGIFNYAMVQQTAYFRVVSSFFVGTAAMDMFLAQINWRPPCCTAVQREGITLNALNNFLDDRTCLGLRFLDTVADAFHVPKIGSPSLLSAAAAAAADPTSLAMAPASAVPVYKEVIQNIHRTFAEELRGATKLYFLFFSDKVPQDFVRQASQYEPMAMFSCMYLGVVLYMTGRDRYFWWTRELGRNLVIETAGMLEHTSIVQLEAGRQGISWARNQIELTA